MIKDKIIKNLSDGDIYTKEDIAFLVNESIEYVSRVLNDPTILKDDCCDGSGIIYYMDFKFNTIVDGEGIRNTIYCSKCDVFCKGCHNKNTWLIENGKPISVNKVINTFLDDDYDITFSGGECSLQAKAFLKVARFIKKNTSKNIWMYTGHTLDYLLEKEDTRKLLRYIDVLVDGEFIENLKDESLLFRGSSNQRIIEKVDGNFVVKEGYYEKNI